MKKYDELELRHLRNIEKRVLKEEEIMTNIEGLWKELRRIEKII